jgi:hypothetical protein
LCVADSAKKTKHIVVPIKQDIIGVDDIDDVEEYTQYDEMNIIGVDGIDDVEEYTQYDEMNLLIDLPKKMRIIEASIRKDDKP